MSTADGAAKPENPFPGTLNDKKIISSSQRGLTKGKS